MKTEKRILWVDDIRNPPTAGYDIARSYDEAIALLALNEYDVAYLDHDLASFTSEGQEKTGYDVLMQIVQMKFDGKKVPSGYFLLTANPVGAERMTGVIDRYLKSA